MAVVRLTVMAAMVALASCDDSESTAPAPQEPRPLAVSNAGQPCPVTLPAGTVRGIREGFNYGNRSLAVALWPKGRLVAGRLPDGGRYATVGRDGSIEAKLGWWRTAKGSLSIEGERLDAVSPPLRAYVPEGYGTSGFQPTGIVFPRPGCWEVIGSVGGAKLRFVVLVRER